MYYVFSHVWLYSDYPSPPNSLLLHELLSVFSGVDCLFHTCLSLVPLAVLKFVILGSLSIVTNEALGWRLQVTDLISLLLQTSAPADLFHQKAFAFWNWGPSLSKTRFHFRVTRQSKQDKLGFPQCQRRGSTKGCQSVLAAHLLPSEGRCLTIPGDNSATVLIGRRAQAMPPSAGSSSDRHPFQFLHF